MASPKRVPVWTLMLVRQALSASSSSEASVIQVMQDWNSQTFGASGFLQGDRNCAVLGVGLKARVISQVMDDLKIPVVALKDAGMANSRHGAILDDSAWCLYTVLQNLTDVQTVLRLATPVHNRRNFFVTNSQVETAMIPIDQVDCPSLIMERLTDGKGSVVVHSACYNCRISLIPRTNVWTPIRGLAVKRVNPTRRCCQTELYGKRLNVSIFGLTPYVSFDPARNPPIYGVDFEMLLLLAEKFRFVPDFVVERTWGLPLGNGSWVGTVGSVQRSLSTIGLGHVGITYQHYQVVDFTTSTYFLEYSYWASLPKRLPPFKNIVAPFFGAVWLAWAATVAAACSAFAVVYFAYQMLAKTVPYSTAPLTSKADFVLMPSAMSVMQGTKGWFVAHPRNSAGSIMFLVWAVGSTLMALFYISNLRASLVAVEYEEPADTIEEMLDSSQNVYHPRQSSMIANMRHSPNEQIRRLFWRAHDRDTYFDYTGNVPEKKFDAMVETQNGFLIGTRDSFKLERRRLYERYGRFPFRFVKEVLTNTHVGMAVPKHCLFVDHLDRAIRGLNEFGVIAHLFVRDVPSRYLLDGLAEKFPEDAQPLGLSTVVTSLMVLVALCLLSLGLFCFELSGRKAGSHKKAQI